ncbi:MAG: hypothetical protein GX786_03040, partial [Clostridiales bacterium]|nr:hypothetical protein [Clostridiales bacterium]
TEIQENLRKDIENTDTSQLSELGVALQGMVESGIVENMDFTMLGGTILDALTIAGFSSYGLETGGQLTKGIVQGAEDGAIELPDGTFLTLKDTFISLINSAFQIESPAKTMSEPGKQITAGLAKGVTDNVDLMTGAVQSLYGAAIAEVQKQEVLLYNAMANLRKVNSGVGSGVVIKPGANNITNYNNTPTVKVGQMVVSSDTNMEVFFKQSQSFTQRHLAGVGNTRKM